MPKSHAAAERSGGISAQAKVIVAILVAAGFVVGYFLLRDQLTLAALVDREQQLRDWQESHPLLVFVAALALYVIVTGLSLPGATPLTLLYGWYFGLVPGVILVSFASTGGATLAFLTSRYLLRDAIERRFRKQLAVVDEAIRREGAFYLLTARLIPGIPFVIVNLVMGLTPMRVWTFWWVSQIGMLPATILYVWAGDSFPDLQTLANRGASSLLTPELIAALVCLGLFPLAVRRLLKSFRRPR